MAGLLDSPGEFIFGNDTEKDEYGQTQMERRQPIWSGLLKTGALLMAGGQRMMPEQRAQYIAQAGGALAGIPEQMVAQTSERARQVLTQQSIVANKTKLANQAKIQAMGKSPEAAAAMAKLDPTRRAAMQAAYDAGDIKSVVDILESTDRNVLGAERLQLQTERQKQLADQAAAAQTVRAGQLENAQRALDLKEQEAQRKREEEFPGTGEAATQARNLKTKDPGSFAYWKAYDYFSTERTGADGTKIGKSNLSGFPPPTYRHSGAPTVDPATDPVQIGAGLKPGNSQTLPDGTRVIHEPDNTIRIEYPGGRVTEQKGPTGHVTTAGPPKPLTGEPMKVFSNNLQSIDKIESLEDELEKNPDAAIGTKMAQITRLPLGAIPADVLNKLDPKGMPIRSLIANISSMIVHDRSGAAVTVSEYPRLAGFIPRDTDRPEEIRIKVTQLKRAMDLENKLYRDNIGKGFMVPPQVSERYDPPKQGAYTMPDGSEFTWEQIETGAKKRDISTNEMIRKYRLKRRE